MYQDTTWYEGRPRVRRHCVRWGPSSPSSKGAQQPPIFGPCLLWPNGWMDQDATWYKGRPLPRPHCGLDGPKKGHSPVPNFRPMSIVTKRSPISATAEHLLFLVLTLISCHGSSLTRAYPRGIKGFKPTKFQCIVPQRDRTVNM